METPNSDWYQIAQRITYTPLVARVHNHRTYIHALLTQKIKTFLFRCTSDAILSTESKRFWLNNLGNFRKEHVKMFFFFQKHSPGSVPYNSYSENFCKVQRKTNLLKDSILVFLEILLKTFFKEYFRATTSAYWMGGTPFYDQCLYPLE